MRAVISVIGSDTVGIIAEVSLLCKKYNLNILDITQSVLQDLFAMIMLVDISEASAPITEIRKSLEDYGKENSLSVHVMHEDIFNSMHRI